MEDLEREMLLIAQGNELAFNSFMNRYMDREFNKQVQNYEMFL